MASKTTTTTPNKATDNAHEQQQQQQHQQPIQQQQQQQQIFTRGVNIGGWLVLERYITPYQFAVTDCHLQGDFCWYPGQLSAPPTASPDYRECNAYDSPCQPVLHAVPEPNDNNNNKNDDPDNPAAVYYDYPGDEYTLAQAFGPTRQDIAAKWWNYHLEHFITLDDIQAIRDSGLTHVRVPLPHWILGSIEPGAPWIVADRWKYFVRLCHWCRQVGLQVWPDIHTAPGSQNGFDNSGHALPAVSCQGWSGNTSHVAQSLQVIRDVTAQIKRDGLDDVVTGFGLLNEPFKDCHKPVYEEFIEQGLDIVRSTLSADTAVYVSDMFLAKTFNDGHWWLDPARYNHTYLDSHYYQVFGSQPRGFSPRQHVAYVCQNEYRDTINCCWRDGKRQTVPSTAGVQRLVGEWSAATDKLPVALLRTVMEGIAGTGIAPQLDRQLSAERQDFLSHYMQAQMVAYEAADSGVSAGWFYWTAKMEGGAFAEWDYLRAVREGWMPAVPDHPTVSSQSLYGTCYDIIFRTNDTMDVIHEFPDPSTVKVMWWEDPIDDDVVLSHGDSLLNVNGHYIEPVRHGLSRNIQNWILWSLGGFAVVMVVRRLLLAAHNSSSNGYRRKMQYEPVGDSTDAEQDGGVVEVERTTTV